MGSGLMTTSDLGKLAAINFVRLLGEVSTLLELLGFFCGIFFALLGRVEGVGAGGDFAAALRLEGLRLPLTGCCLDLVGEG
jgi:hypothetical protein